MIIPSCMTLVCAELQQEADRAQGDKSVVIETGSAALFSSSSHGQREHIIGQRWAVLICTSYTHVHHNVPTLFISSAAVGSYAQSHTHTHVCLYSRTHTHTQSCMESVWGFTILVHIQLLN